MITRRSASRRMTRRRRSKAALNSSGGNEGILPQESAEPGNLLLGHDALDILGLALDTIARAAVGLDRQAGNDGVDAAFLRRGAALRALLLVMNVVIDRVVMGHRRVFPVKKGF